MGDGENELVTRLERRGGHLFLFLAGRYLWYLYFI